MTSRCKPPLTPEAQGTAPVPTARGADRSPAPGSSQAEVTEFLARMKELAPAAAGGRGQLVFAMDATMSR